jgi:hypothetical protein
MKYYKFEKLQGENNPIIRITYKNWWGKLVIKDVCKSNVTHCWCFMENGYIVFNSCPINNFHNNKSKFYWVNGL